GHSQSSADGTRRIRACALGPRGRHWPPGERRGGRFDSTAAMLFDNIRKTPGGARPMSKYVFVTGGVTSSLGKGITAASIGRILKARGLPVSILKLDPYINVDPGTMSPYQHGEVFVTDDGAETDLDLGHYERFIDENLTQLSNVTTGRIYQAVIAKER